VEVALALEKLSYAARAVAAGLSMRGGTGGAGGGGGRGVGDGITGWASGGAVQRGEVVDAAAGGAIAAARVGGGGGGAA
jgi:hypothetical protein